MNTHTITFNKRLFLVRAYSVTLLVIVSYLVLYLFLPVPVYKAYALMVLAFVMVTGITILHTKASLTFVAHFYILGCYLLLCFNMATSGGILAPGTPWFVLCPLVGFLTLTARAAAFWLLVVLATLCLFYNLNHYLVFDSFQGGDHWYLVVYVLLFPTIYIFIHFFRIEVSKKNLELKALNELLEEKQRYLEESHQEMARQRNDLRRAEEEANERNRRSTNYLNQLIEISRMEELHSGSFEYAIQTIQRILMSALDLEGVVIWQCTNENVLQRISSIGLVDTEICDPARLTHDDFQEPFELLTSGAIVVNNPETQQLGLQFSSIKKDASIIACPYFIDGKFAGFFSCIGNSRQWLPEDIVFIRAVSDALPLAFRSYQRKQEKSLLEEKQYRIIELNELLEMKVKERTALLELRNKQLTNFAFINAHEIRGPICRLLGLRNLLKKAMDCKEIILLGGHMTTSIDELDQITRKATALLAESTLEENYKS